MKIKLSIKELEKVKKELDILNKHNGKFENNFINLECEKNIIVVSYLQNNKEALRLHKNLFYNEVLGLNIFDYRETFKGLLTNEGIDVYTSIETHLHTKYSLLDGMIKPDKLIEKSFYSAAITDHGTMAGCFNFYKNLIKTHKHPIIGFEAYTESIDGLTFNDKGNPQSFHLILLAKNKTGYKNLCKLNTLANKYFAEVAELAESDDTVKKLKKGFIKHEWFKEYSEGIICSTACIGGEIQQALKKGDKNLARRVLESYLSIFGDDFYIEIQNHKFQEEATIVNLLTQLAEAYNVKVIASTDAHFLNEDDSLTHESTLALARGKTMDDNDRLIFSGEGYHFHTCEEKEELFKRHPNALFNTLEIMEKCSFNYPGYKGEKKSYIMPNFPIPEGYTQSSYLEYISHKGFIEKFEGTQEFHSKEYKDRLKFELETIINMGFPSYFSITHDFMNFCLENDIPTGAGRGSACGSLVAYVLGITSVDPIRYDLLFERFLNPSRISMPDIDNDIADIHRETVINYCRKKYGAETIARISTFGSECAKVAILDTARVWGKTNAFARSISNKIPNEPKITILKALAQNPELKDMYNSDEDVRDIIDKAMKIEGNLRNQSSHACGVIMADADISDYAPLIYLQNKETGKYEPTVQLTMGECEELGLLKMDFLGRAIR